VQQVRVIALKEENICCNCEVKSTVKAPRHACAIVTENPRGTRSIFALRRFPLKRPGGRSASEAMDLAIAELCSGVVAYMGCPAAALVAAADASNTRQSLCTLLLLGPELNPRPNGKGSPGRVEADIASQGSRGLWVAVCEQDLCATGSAAESESCQTRTARTKLNDTQAIQ